MLFVNTRQFSSAQLVAQEIIGISHYLVVQERAPAHRKDFAIPVLILNLRFALEPEVFFEGISMLWLRRHIQLSSSES